MIHCEKCGRDLSNDEIAIYRKLIGRQARTFLCKYCLSGALSCEVELIDEKIRHYREQGCFLFSDTKSGFTSKSAD